MEKHYYSFGAFGKRQLIMFDTCSILNDSFEQCIKSLSRNTGTVIAIPYAVINELKYLQDSVASNCRAKARHALETVSEMRDGNRLALVGSPDEPEQGDHAILRFALEGRFKLSICVITQDRTLSADLNDLNKISSASIPPIQIKRIGRYGKLIDYEADSSEHHKPSGGREVRGAGSPNSKLQNERILARFGL